MRRRRIKTRNLPRIRRVLSSLEVPPLFVPHFRGVSSGDAHSLGDSRTMINEIKGSFSVSIFFLPLNTGVVINNSYVFNVFNVARWYLIVARLSRIIMQRAYECAHVRRVRI